MDYFISKKVSLYKDWIIYMPKAVEFQTLKFFAYNLNFGI